MALAYLGVFNKWSIPAQRPTSLILDHSGLEEVLLLLQVHDLAHPREGVGGAWVLFLQADLGQAAVGDELEVVLHHRGVHAQYAARHGVTRVFDLQLGTLQDHLGRFVLHLGVPQVRVFDLDLVDHVDAEVQVHGLVTQDVLELLGGAGHLVAATHGEDLGEAAVEEDAFQYAVVGDQVAQELAVGFRGAGFELGIGDRAGVLQAPGGLLRDARDLVVHVEDLAFIHAQRFDAVLVGVGVDRFLEGLAQDVLAALGVGDQAVHGQDQVVGNQAVGGGEEAEVAHDDAALVFAETVCGFPQRDVGVHVHFLRHPMVGATIQILLPGPVVLEGYELVEVGAGVDHLLVADLYARGGAFEVVQAFLDVEVVQGFLGAGDGLGVVGVDGAGLLDRAGSFAVELVEVGAGALCVGVACGGCFCAVFLVEFIPAQHGLAPA